MYVYIKHFNCLYKNNQIKKTFIRHRKKRRFTKRNNLSNVYSQQNFEQNCFAERNNFLKFYELQKTSKQINFHFTHAGKKYIDCPRCEHLSA